MKASELRIGNYVLCEGEVATVQIIHGRLNIVVVNTGERDWCNNPDKLQPIPLTDRVLWACGLMDDYDVLYEDEMYPDMRCYFYLPDGGGWEVIYNVSDIDYSPKYCSPTGIIATFHDLQNYYYALKGEELEIDEEKLKQAII